MLGKFNQILVLAPVGAAIGGALSYLGKKAMALSGEEAGGWVAAARFVGRGFCSGAAEAAAGPGSR
jgi:hypothetical protein